MRVNETEAKERNKYVSASQVHGSRSPVIKLQKPVDAVPAKLSLADYQEIPRIPRNCVRRQRLFDKFEILSDVTIVQSLPGRGKSIALADWASYRRSMGDKIVWINATAETMTSSVHRTLTVELHKEQSQKKSTQRTIVVVDDAHAVALDTSGEELLADLAQLPDCHLVFGTSHELKVEVSALLSGLSVNRISGQDLLITQAEICELAEAWGLPVSVERAAELLTLTGGWLWVLQLVLNGSVADYGSISGGPVWDIAKQEVLSSIRVPELLEIAQSIALLEVIDLESVTALKNAAVGLLPGWDAYEPSDAIFALQRSGQILPLAESEGRSWIFPKFVRNCLRVDIENQIPGISASIHGTLAEFFENQASADLIGKVFIHARLGERWDVLSRVYAAYGSWGCHQFRDEAKVAFDSVPLEIQESFPAIALAIASVDDNQLKSSPFAVEASVSTGSVKHLTDFVVQESTPAVAAVNATAIVEALQVQGQLGQALEFLEWALQHLDASRSNALTPLNRATLYFQHSRLLFMLNRTDESIEPAQTAFDYSKSLSTKTIRCLAAGQLALIYTLKNQYLLAKSWVEAAEEVVATLFPQETAAVQPLKLAKAFLAIEQLDSDSATKYLKQASEHCSETGLDSIIAVAESELSLISGQSSEYLLRALHEKTLAPDIQPLSGEHPVADSFVPLLIADGHLNRVSRVLADYQPTSAKFSVHKSYLLLLAGEYERAWILAGKVPFERHTPRDQVQLQLTIAVAALEMGDQKSAQTAAIRAHQIAKMTRSYFALAKFQSETLQQLADLAEISWGNANQQRFGIAYPNETQLVRLSEREGVVLRALQEFDTFPSIAAHLFVSVNTVKKQIHNVYRKLGVNSKQAALARGIELGLCDV